MSRGHPLVLAEGAHRGPPIPLHRPTQHLSKPQILDWLSFPHASTPGLLPPREPSKET